MIGATSSPTGRMWRFFYFPFTTTLNPVAMQKHRNQVNGQQSHRRATDGVEVGLISNDPVLSPREAVRPEISSLSPEEQAVKDFKVFLKKHLPQEKPAPDLLVKIHQRIDQLQHKQ